MNKKEVICMGNEAEKDLSKLESFEKELAKMGLYIKPMTAEVKWIRSYNGVFQYARTDTDTIIKSGNQELSLGEFNFKLWLEKSIGEFKTKSLLVIVQK